MPAALFMWARGQEIVGRDRQMMAYVILVAAATAFGGDKSKSMFPTLIDRLGGEEPEDFLRTASEATLRVMYGSRYKGRDGGEQ